MRRAILAFVCRLGGSRSGAAALEMALVGPLVIFMGLVAIDFGMAIYAKMIVTDAAQEGAAYAQVNASTFSSCTSNSPPCTFDGNVVTAATKGHPTGSFIVPTVTASVLCCSVSGGAVNCGSPATAPSSTTGTCSSGVGTYVQIQSTASYTTLLPYNFMSGILGLGINITNPLSLRVTSLVRIQ